MKNNVREFYFSSIIESNSGMFVDVNLLVQFAFMESRFDDPERAEALLEKVLASYPRRVDVWTSYVDMLIKGNRIHIAR